MSIHDTSLRTALVAQAAALEAQAATLRALAEHPSGGASSADDDTPMITDDVCQRRPVTPGWLRAHVVACGRGARQRLVYRLSDVDAALAASPVIPRPRKCDDDEDEVAAMLASGELVRR